MSRVECEVCGHEAFVGEDPQTKVFREALGHVGELLCESGLRGAEVVYKVESVIDRAFKAYPGKPYA